MCSSRPVPDEPGVFEITTPGAMVEVGQRFLVVGGLAHALKIERDIRRFGFAHWAARLGSPASANAAVVPDPTRLAEAQRMGLLHPSLSAEPVGPDQLAA